MVAVIEAEPSTHQLLVHTQGANDAKRRWILWLRWSKVVEVSDAFADGGFFEKDDFCPLNVMTTSLRWRGQSALAQAEQRLAEERGRSRQARREWRELGSDEANDPARKPQLEHELAVKAAQADVAAAELALDAPLSGTF